MLLGRGADGGGEEAAKGRKASQRDGEDGQRLPFPSHARSKMAGQAAGAAALLLLLLPGALAERPAAAPVTERSGRARLPRR